ncbi:hypothetical protein [Phaeobacter phage MD18]|nr:hypothetical protein [Phaeobacter phage MD18]
MTEKEFVLTFRWVVGVLIILNALLWAPGLISAPDDRSVIVGIMLLIGSIIGATSFVMGRCDKYLRIAHFHIHHAFFK